MIDALAKAFEDEMEMELDTVFQKQQNTWSTTSQGLGQGFHLIFDSFAYYCRPLNSATEKEPEQPGPSGEKYDDDYFDSSDDEKIR